MRGTDQTKHNPGVEASILFACLIEAFFDWLVEVISRDIRECERYGILRVE